MKAKNLQPSHHRWLLFFFLDYYFIFYSLDLERFPFHCAGNKERYLSNNISSLKHGNNILKKRE